jgi:hypothetical protein
VPWTAISIATHHRVDGFSRRESTPANQVTFEAASRGLAAQESLRTICVDRTFAK